MNITEQTNSKNVELLGLLLAYVIAKCFIDELDLVVKLWNQEAKKYNNNILNKRG